VLVGCGAGLEVPGKEGGLEAALRPAAAADGGEAEGGGPDEYKRRGPFIAVNKQLR